MFTKLSDSHRPLGVTLTSQKVCGKLRGLWLATILLCFGPAAIADAISLHAPIWCYASVDLTVIGGAYSHSTGVKFPQCLSPDTTINGAKGSTATGAASTNAIWGTSVTALSDNGGTAGPANRFLEPIELQPGPGVAIMNSNSVRLNDILTISGTTQHNENGFLELSVLNLAGLNLSDQQDLTTQIFLTYGSVEKALAANFISNARVLFRERETMFSSNDFFSRSVFVGLAADNDIVVVSLASSASLPVPEPETLAMVLTALGLLAFESRRRKNKDAA